ncbi:MAG: DUF4340 domain-containing protein [Spirochaetaceae bacterium]|jgi:hypothetical protein|nr:DUF4340 domain-containing protein [Spirochaetaceae bacterium]
MMKSFKKKAIVLGGIAGVLALVYALTFIFDSERSDQWQAAYRWLDPQSVSVADRIEVRGSDTVDLEKTDGTWFVVYEGKRFPAKQSRVDELFTALTQSGAYATRGSSREIQEKLGLTDEQTSRITVLSGGNPLLALLVGVKDASESSIHLRKQGDDTVRGGEDRFSTFTNGSRPSWEDLRLFPDENGVKLNADAIQRFTVFPPPDPDADPDKESNAQPYYTLVRDGKGWKAELLPTGVSGEPKTADIDAYVRGIVDAVGEDFAAGLSPGDEGFTDADAVSRVVLELGDGSTRTLYRGPDFSDKKTISLSGSPYVWLLSDWTANRIFRTGEELFTD